jgi:hypothetical protein
MKLKSVKLLQTCVILPNDIVETLTPVLSFGHGKKNERRVPIYFILDNEHHAKKLIDELQTIVGFTYDEVIQYLRDNLPKYSKFKFTIKN